MEHKIPPNLMRLHLIKTMFLNVVFVKFFTEYKVIVYLRNFPAWSIACAHSMLSCILKMCHSLIKLTFYYFFFVVFKTNFCSLFPKILSFTASFSPFFFCCLKIKRNFWVCGAILVFFAYRKIEKIYSWLSM
jgi:hypothetical protein